MRYQLLVCVLVILLLAFSATVKGEKPDIGIPDLKMTGDTIEDAELTVTVTVSGENITKVILFIQACSGLSCYLPVEVEMESVGPAQYSGTYSEFVAEYEYYQYMVKGENGEGESHQTDFTKLKSLPGYEDNGTDDDDSTGDDDTTPEDDTDENTSEDSPGFGLGMVGSMVLLGVFFRKKYN